MKSTPKQSEEVRIAVWMPREMLRQLKGRLAMDGKTLSDWVRESARVVLEKKR